jgi:N-acetylneuraminate synthase
LEPKELSELCSATKTAWTALGDIDYGCKSSEVGTLQFRRSLYFVNNLRVGMKIKPSDIRSVRPGYGLAPKKMDDVIGRKVTRNIAAFSPVKNTDFE